MFHPNMRAMTEGFSVIGSLCYRSWSRRAASTWGRTGGRCGSPRVPRG
jgi:hypothetical protein